MLIGINNDKMPSDGTPFTAECNSYIEHLMSHFHVPGLSIGVVNGDQTTLRAFGDAKVSTEPATEDTLYFIASVTKSFTATTLLCLMEELADTPKAFTLKTKISSIIPDDFVLPDDYATSHATLEDAMSHMLGVGGQNFSYGGDGYTLRDAVRSLRHLSMTTELREKFQYLNMGYMVIQHVIETLTGKPIEESHRKYIWGPLGMSSTFIKLSDAREAQNLLANGYTWHELNGKLQDAQYASDYPLVGGGGIISSIKDFTKYLHAVIHKDFPLQDSRMEELFKPRSIQGTTLYDHHTSPTLYGLGWGVASYRGRRFISHSGGITGFASRLLFLPDQKWGVALLANEDTSGIIDAVALSLMDDYLGIPLDARQDIVPGLDREAREKVEWLLTTRKRLYPDVPEPPLPLTLPLSEYAGTYYNPGYRTLELAVAKPLEESPVADGTTEVLHTGMRRLVNFTLDLEHVSGDYFIAWTDAEKTSMIMKMGLRARFTIDSDGRVKRLGMNLGMSSDDDDPMMVWFTKVN